MHSFDLCHDPVQLQQGFILYMTEILVWLMLQKVVFNIENLFFQPTVDLFVTLGINDEKSSSDSCLYFSHHLSE